MLQYLILGYFIMFFKLHMLYSVEWQWEYDDQLRVRKVLEGGTSGALFEDTVLPPKILGVDSEK
jgi:hypothetical protein